MNLRLHVSSFPRCSPMFLVNQEGISLMDSLKVSIRWMKDYMNHHQKLDKGPGICKLSPQLAPIEFSLNHYPCYQENRRSGTSRHFDKRLVIILPITPFRCCSPSIATSPLSDSQVAMEYKHYSTQHRCP
jgi:hypothetical protein